MFNLPFNFCQSLLLLFQHLNDEIKLMELIMVKHRKRFSRHSPQLALLYPFGSQKKFSADRQLGLHLLRLHVI